MRLAAWFPLVLAASPLACATTYEPKSPRIAVVRGELRRGFVKDGVYYPGGLFGGRVGEAVEGVPEAERHACMYGSLSTAGTVTIFGSEGIAIGASIVSATAARGEAKNDAELGLIIGSAVALVTGIALHLVAEPHLYDAANIYNDEMDRRHAAASRPAPTAVPASAAPSTAPPPSAAPEK
jgi:hypothetical protein